MSGCKKTSWFLVPLRERQFDFYGGGGGGREDYFGPGNIVRRTLEPGFLFFAWYGPGFFSARNMCIKTKQKSLLYWR